MERWKEIGVDKGKPTEHHDDNTQLPYGTREKPLVIQLGRVDKSDQY